MQSNLPCGYISLVELKELIFSLDHSMDGLNNKTKSINFMIIEEKLENDNDNFKRIYTRSYITKSELKNNIDDVFERIKQEFSGTENPLSLCFMLKGPEHSNVTISIDPYGISNTIYFDSDGISEKKALEIKNNILKIIKNNKVLFSFKNVYLFIPPIIFITLFFFVLLIIPSNELIIMVFSIMCFVFGFLYLMTAIDIEKSKKMYMKFRKKHKTGLLINS